MIAQLCSSTLNVRKFLEKGLLDELINLVLLGGDDNIKEEAVVCLSKVNVFLLSFGRNAQIYLAFSSSL